MRRFATGLFAFGMFAAACSSGGGGNAAPSPANTSGEPEASEVASPAATVTPTATAGPWGEVEPKPLVAGEPVPLPAGLMLYARDAVWEGPAEAVRRYYRGPDGTMVAEPLLVSTGEWNSPDARMITSTSVVPGGGEWAIGLCHGSCYGGIQPVTVVRSADGGVSWQELGTLDPTGWVVAVTPGGAVVQQYGAADGVPLTTLPPSGDFAPQFPPDTREDEIDAGYRGRDAILATPSTDGRTLWALDGSSEPLASVPKELDEPPISWAFADHLDGPRVVATWVVQPGQTGFFAVSISSSGAWEQAYSWSADEGLHWVGVTAWVSETVAIGRADFNAADYIGPPQVDFAQSTPAIIDFERGVVSPIAEFVPDLAKKAGGPVPLAIVPGPFALVSGAGEGDCLNVRESPGAGSPVLACYRDGVLLTVSGERAVLDGEDWVAVRTPDGRAGWLAAGFLWVFDR